MNASSGSGLWPTRISCWLGRRWSWVQSALVTSRWPRAPAAKLVGRAGRRPPAPAPARGPCRRSARSDVRACVHDHHRRLQLLVVGQVVDHRHHLGGHLRVEGAGRLVEQDRRRVNRKGPGDRNTLLLPAGKLVRPARPPCRPARPGRAAAGASPRPRPATARGRTRGPAMTFSQGRHVREQVELLEHHADLPPQGAAASPSASAPSRRRGAGRRLRSPRRPGTAPAR